MPSSYLTRRMPSKLSFTTQLAIPSSMLAETQTQSISTPSGLSSSESGTESLTLAEMTPDSSLQPGITSASSLCGDLQSPTSKSHRTAKSMCLQMVMARSSSTSQSTSLSSTWCSKFRHSGASTSELKLMLSNLVISSTLRSTSKRSKLKISQMMCQNYPIRLLSTTTSNLATTSPTSFITTK